MLKFVGNLGRAHEEIEELVCLILFGSHCH